MTEVLYANNEMLAGYVTASFGEDKLTPVMTIVITQDRLDASIGRLFRAAAKHPSRPSCQSHRRQRSEACPRMNMEKRRE